MRKQGHSNVNYIDDSLLQGESFEECERNIQGTIQLLDSLRFTVHPTKSVLKPVKQIQFLGFMLDSEKNGGITYKWKFVYIVKSY